MYENFMLTIAGASMIVLILVIALLILYVIDE